MYKQRMKLKKTNLFLFFARTSGLNAILFETFLCWNGCAYSEFHGFCQIISLLDKNFKIIIIHKIMQKLIKKCHKATLDFR